ncbi:MAG TPA: hypothetical protein VF059_01615 [Casimicrobiaceae bacterium]
MIVGVYESRRDADAARARLLEEGLHEGRIAVAQGADADKPPASVGGTPLTDDATDGLAGFIGRMFSGAFPEDSARERYADALRNGRCVIAVRTESDAESNIATAILARAEPRVYSLPNAPSGWKEASAGDPASLGGVDDDPGRPQGLLDDAEGLGPDADRRRLSEGSRTSRSR